MMNKEQVVQVLIVEDEPTAANNLKHLIAQVRPRYEVLNSIDSVKDSVTWLAKNTADLVFLDIHLADGSSFEIFEQVQVNAPIIFTTAYDQYAIKAFKVNSVDYLMKPLKQNELELAIAKFENLHSRNVGTFKMDELAGLFKQPPSFKKRFTIQLGPKIKTIPVEEIAMFYVMEGEPFLITMDGKHFDMQYSLDKLELLLDPEAFFRINRQIIINFGFIDEMYHLSKSRMGIKLKVNVDFEILVSFRKMPAFRDWIER